MIKFGNTYLNPETGVTIVVNDGNVTVQGTGPERNMMRPTLEQTSALREYLDYTSVDVVAWSLKKQEELHPMLTLQIPEQVPALTAKPPRKAKS